MKLIIHKNPEPQNYITGIFGLRESINWTKSVAEIVEDHIDFMDIARKNKHISAIGFLGLTHFGAISQFGYGINYKDIGRFIYEIFIRKETGTLYPKYNLTILPYNLNPDYYLNRIEDEYLRNAANGSEYSKDEIDTFIADCFKAELEVIKSGELFFNFKDVGFDALDYYYSVLHYVEKNKTSDLIVHMESVNNVEFMEEKDFCKLQTRQTNRNKKIGDYNKSKLWKEIEEENKNKSWYKRAEKRKLAIKEFRAIPKNEMQAIRERLRIDFYKRSVSEKVKQIVNDKKYPPEYYPIQWVGEILEFFSEFDNLTKQELYNKLSVKVYNKEWRLLKNKLKMEKGII